MGTRSVRQSNIELLRIVAIFLVMVAHCNGFMAEGHIPSMTDGNVDAVVICRNIIASLASICVVLFVLISGWFSIKPNFKSIVTLWTQVFFIYLYLIGLQYIVRGGVSVNLFISCFLPFTLGNWFVRAYLILMIFSPVLNGFAERVSRRGFQLFLVAFTAAAMIWGCVFASASAGFNEGLSPLSLIYVYMVGRYLKLHVQIGHSKWFYFAGYLFFSLLIFIGRAVDVSWILSYCNPILVLSAVSLFLFFVKWDIGHVRIINWTASSVFAAFIFHTREPIIGWLRDFNVQKLHTLPYIEYLALMLVVLVVVFMVAVLMDKLRALIFKPLIDIASRIVISTDDNDKLIKIIKK